MEPRLSVVVLTLDEEDNIVRLLRALAAQHERDFEIIVVDAASTDRTVEFVEEAQLDFPVQLRLEACDRRLPIGEARNLGAALALADHVAYISADAEPGPRWTERALANLEQAALVFGPQVHDPDAWTAAAAVRGLRYTFPHEPVDDPLPFASNVAAAYNKGVLAAFPFEPGADAAEDLLLARRAAGAGHPVAYDPAMIVRHHDVLSWREELRKNVREGYAWGRHTEELGVLWRILAWGGALVMALAATLTQPLLGAVAFATVLWVPAVVRGARRRGAMAPRQILKGVLASPPFDLVFLIQYVRGLLGLKRPRADRPRPKETRA